MSNPSSAKIVSIGEAYSESRKQAFHNEPLIQKALEIFNASPDFIATPVSFSRQMGKTALLTEISRRRRDAACSDKEDALKLLMEAVNQREDAVRYRSLNCLLLLLVLTRRAHVSTIDKHETRIRHGY